MSRYEVVKLSPRDQNESVTFVSMRSDTLIRSALIATFELSQTVIS